MTRLKARIVEMIRATGPISVQDFMALCLADPQDGYYMTRDPFGAGGDFTTAPEISQMFGELIGAWLAATWQSMGAPHDAMVVEIGPGRGTLMKDVARTLRKIAPALHRATRYRLIEISERLAALQARTLRETDGVFEWHDHVAKLPKKPLLIVGNELFDALPARQYVKTQSGWRERLVDADGEDGLRFIAGPGSLDPSLLPPGAGAAAEGAIFEVAPARTALLQAVAGHIGHYGGAGLFIDYGHLVPGVGDTLQALRKHDHDDPLANLGKADLTTHVDFAALAETARACGLKAQSATQGDFLLRLGLLERAGALGARAGEDTRERLRGEVERLAAPDQMGTLFKVLAIARRQVPLPGFDAAD